MLVLGVRPGESVHVGDDIVVHVVRLEGGKMRLGFEAPDEVEILRSTLVESHRREQGPFETGKVVEA